MHGSAFLLELGGVILLLAILARVAQRFGFSPIPLYLLAGLAFGQGGLIPLVTADRFIAAGAEIGLILLLFSLGLEYSARELVDAVRTSSRVGAIDRYSTSRRGSWRGCCSVGGSSPRSSWEA